MSSKPVSSDCASADILEQAAEFGIKRICQSCSGKYYDLNKSPIVCPTCDTEWDPEATLSRRRSRITDEAKPKPESDSDEDENEENEDKAEESEEDLVKDIPDVDVEEDDDFEQTDDATLLEEDDDDSPILPEVVIESDDEKADG